MRINLTDEEIGFIVKALNLNYISNNLEELKDDKELYNEYKKGRKVSNGILHKFTMGVLK